MAQAHHVALARPLLALGMERLYKGLWDFRGSNAVFRGAYQLHRAEAAEQGMTRDRFHELSDLAVVRQLVDGKPALFHLSRLIGLDR
jgi:hypothetical protein